MSQQAALDLVGNGAGDHGADRHRQQIGQLGQLGKAGPAALANGVPISK